MAQQEVALRIAGIVEPLARVMQKPEVPTVTTIWTESNQKRHFQLEL